MLSLIVRISAIAALLAAAPSRAEFSFLEIPEMGESIVKLSADGRTVVGSTRSNGIYHAAVWTSATGMVSIGGLPGGDGSSNAYGVSADGRVVVGRSSSAQGFEAFRWSADAGMILLGDLPGGGPFSSLASAVSADGNVVVGFSSSASLLRAFRWTATTGMVDLGSLGGGFSAAYAVTPDGNIVAGSSRSSAGQDAFIWTAANGMSSLGALANGGRTQRASAISADGKVVVGLGANSSFEAFRWTQNGAVALGTFEPTNPGSWASGVSADGNVVVGMGSGVDADGNGEAFVWFPERGILDLRKYLLAHNVSAVQGWRLSEASGISDDGRTLAGWGINPQGRRAAWIVQIEIDTSTAPTDSPPAAPSSLNAAPSVTQVQLQWNDNAANEAGFHLERCQGINCANFIQIAQPVANVRSFVDTRLNRNTDYRYRVRAVNNAGNSTYSNVVTVRTLKR